MMRRIVWLGLAVAVGGCTEEPWADEKVPTSYYVRKVDLYRETPDDICCFKDRDYLEKLIGRVTEALPEGTLWSDFEDFNARPSSDGKAMEAVMRFHATSVDSDAVMMFAIGPFNANNCRVGHMNVGVGPNASDPHARIVLKIK